MQSRKVTSDSSRLVELDGDNSSPGRSRIARVATKLTLALAVVAGSGLTAPSALAAENPYERGPDPTESSIEAPRGSFDVSTETVSSWEADGFGGGTVYYPSDSDGPFGAVAISPGYTAGESTMSWYGPRLASRGFVIITIETESRLDFPSSRADQLMAALDYVTESSSASDIVDPSRLGLMGHSMGGGGTIEAAAENPQLETAVPLTPWHTTKNWSGLDVPTMVIGAEDDSVAPVSSHAEPFYESMPGSLDKAYLELNGASHFAPVTSNTTIAKYSIAWLKRFIDNDTRYAQFLCPAPSGSAIEEYRETCPY